VEAEESQEEIKNVFSVLYIYIGAAEKTITKTGSSRKRAERDRRLEGAGAAAQFDRPILINGAGPPFRSPKDDLPSVAYCSCQLRIN